MIIIDFILNRKFMGLTRNLASFLDRPHDEALSTPCISGSEDFCGYLVLSSGNSLSTPSKPMERSTRSSLHIICHRLDPIGHRYTVGSGIPATDDDDMLILCRDARFFDFTELILCLFRQIIHRELDILALSAFKLQVPLAVSPAGPLPMMAIRVSSLPVSFFLLLHLPVFDRE